MSEPLIETYWVFIADDETNLPAFGEGVVGEIMPGLGSTPFMTHTPRVRDQLKVRAQALARETGRHIRLVEFTRGKVLETYWGRV